MDGISSRGDSPIVHFVSVIIPNRNGGSTIGACLKAAFATQNVDFEVIVVDDFSDDDSIDVIEQFPCRIVRLTSHSGAAKARNTGAQHSKGDILFFTDADCLLQEDTVTRACAVLGASETPLVVGGTYTLEPADPRFFSRFQSVFIHYSETKHASDPDYIASHAMAMTADTFRQSGGFSESQRPILEDVELSHRIRRQGVQLLIDPNIQVRHFFNFSLLGSLQNAMRKSMYWIIYSLGNGDLLADSGTASLELKANVVSYFFSLLCLLISVSTSQIGWLVFAIAALIVNIVINRQLLLAFYRTGGILFFLGATLYYLGLYALPVGLGGVAGAIRYRRDS